MFIQIKAVLSCEPENVVPHKKGYYVKIPILCHFIFLGFIKRTRMTQTRGLYFISTRNGVPPNFVNKLLKIYKLTC